jgi:hypothetical protein
MEKIPGIELERVWPTMKTEDRLAVVQAIADYQKNWTLFPLKSMVASTTQKISFRVQTMKPCIKTQMGLVSKI